MVSRDRKSNERQTLLLRDSANPERLATQPCSPWHRLLVRVFASSLDRQLASGILPESSPLLAARAARIVSPPEHWSLAQNWQALLVRAHGAPVARNPHATLCRNRIVAAEGEARTMLCALTASLPAPVRGVAMASSLLSDGAGPLFNRNCDVDLRTALRKVTAQLDPTVPLVVSA